MQARKDFIQDGPTALTGLFEEERIVPPAGSSEKDFDFFIGSWKTRNRKLKTRLNNCQEWEEFDATQDVYKILLGLGNIDHFHTVLGGVPFEGMTLRLFDRTTRLWSLYWASSSKGVLEPPVVGSFEGKVGLFYGKDVVQGQPVRVVFCWDAREDDKPVWSQAFSADEGKTWEWNWYMYMERQ